MKYASLAILIAGVCLTYPATSSAQGKKDDIAGKPVAEWLRILREDERPNFRRAALLALKAGDAAGGSARLAIFETAEKDKDTRVRRDAIAVIGGLGPNIKGTLKTLVSILQTPKNPDEVREAAALAISGPFLEGKALDVTIEYMNVYIDALKDPHADTRLAVASLLRNLGKNAEPAVPALIEVAKRKDEQPLVRAAALHVISRHGKANAETWKVAVAIVADEKTPIALREAAAEALGRSASDAPEVIEVLARTLTEKDDDLRKAGAVSLNSLGVKAKASWPTVKSRLNDSLEPNSGIRSHLIRLCGSLGKDTPDAVTLLAKLAEKDVSTENRIAAIQELGALGAAAKSSLPTLTKLASQDARAAVREEAMTAMKRIQASGM